MSERVRVLLKLVAAMVFATILFQMCYPSNSRDASYETKLQGQWSKRQTQRDIAMTSDDNSDKSRSNAAIMIETRDESKSHNKSYVIDNRPPVMMSTAAATVDLFPHRNTLHRTTNTLCTTRINIPGHFVEPRSESAREEMHQVPLPSDLCGVDDVSSIPALYWRGYWNPTKYHPKDETKEFPPARIAAPWTLDNETGEPIQIKKFNSPSIPQAEYILEIMNGRVSGDSGTVFDASNIYTDSRWYRFPPTSNQKLEYVGKALITFAVLYGELFQHFIIDVAAKVGIALAWLKANPEVKILHSGGVAARFFGHLGIDKKRQISADHRKVYTADVVYFPGFSMQAMMGVLPSGAYDAFRQELGGKYQPMSASLRKRTVLFLDRTYPDDRSMNPKHFQFVIDSITTHLDEDTQLVLFSENKADDWTKDRALFDQADVVIAVHGGAEANIVFCRPGTELLEIIPRLNMEYQVVKTANMKGQVRPCYHGMAYALGLRYWQIEPLNFGFSQGNVKVDPIRIVKILAALGYARHPQ